MLDPKKIFFVPSEEVHFEGTSQEAFYTAINNSPAAERLHLNLLNGDAESTESFLCSVSEKVERNRFKTLW